MQAHGIPILGQPISLSVHVHMCAKEPGIFIAALAHCFSLSFGIGNKRSDVMVCKMPRYTDHSYIVLVCGCVLPAVVSLHAAATPTLRIRHALNHGVCLLLFL